MHVFGFNGVPPIGIVAMLSVNKKTALSGSPKSLRTIFRCLRRSITSTRTARATATRVWHLHLLPRAWICVYSFLGQWNADGKRHGLGVVDFQFLMVTLLAEFRGRGLVCRAVPQWRWLGICGAYVLGQGETMDNPGSPCGRDMRVTSRTANSMASGSSPNPTAWCMRASSRMGRCDDTSFLS